MSNLLNEAIVDAKALREAALKNAETLILDKYSDQVRNAVTQLLEQEEEEVPLDLMGSPEGDMGGEMDMGMPEEPMQEGEGEEVAENIPLAATDNLSENEGENLSGLPQSGEDVEVEINLDALQEAIQTLQDEQEVAIDDDVLAQALGLTEKTQIGADDLYNVDETGTDDDDDEENSAQALAASAAAVTADSTTMKRAGLEEELEISDEMIDDIAERLVVDMGATLSGWAGRSSESQKYEMEREMARRRSTDVEDDLKNLKKAYEELVFENKQLQESLKKHKQATNELREGLHDVNLSNARLLYTNRVLRNTSLNERQKTKVVDAISQAGSVTEAKTIYQTLESAVESTPKRGPQSLSEAIGRRSTSVIRASRKESISSDPIAERMKRLAGIN